jgi:Flp pilus assembly protein TadB
MGDDAAIIGATLSFHSEAGGDIARSLDRLAMGLDDRHVSIAKGRIAGAAAKLSGRLVAGLPLAFVPLLPAAHASLFDGVGICLVVAGVGLAVAGMVWMGRLIPAAPAHDDAVAAVADRISILLDAGIPLGAALHSVMPDAPIELRSAAARTRRLYDLGLSWTAALGRSGDPALVQLGTAIDRGARNGLPLARTLDRFAAERRADIARAFEEAARKASVWVVVPLVLCVLPSFALLALAPFLRGLAFG